MTKGRRGPLVLWGCLAAWGIACGSRTELRGAPTCHDEGATRACRSVCGEGVTACEDGGWSACRVPPEEKSCEGVCGLGRRTCVDEQWSACLVEPVRTSCTNLCGMGVQECVAEVWGPCVVEPVERSCTFGCGDGVEVCSNNQWGPCDAPRPAPPVLSATIRDFAASHPDFQQNLRHSAVEPGIVLAELGPDDKPVYAQGGQRTQTTNGEQFFNQWYRNSIDAQGQPINLALQYDLRMVPSPIEPEFYVYGNPVPGVDQFFPIDDQLFGNYPGTPHNYHFTLEASFEFVYRQGQLFRFNGDDDLWVFINRRLAIDLGGLHPARGATAYVDEIALETGMIQGERYQLHLFFAERQTYDSNFYIETSIADLGQCN